MIYLFTFNNQQPNVDTAKLHESIKSLTGIIDWWHYLPNTYLIDSTLGNKQIADTIIANHPGLLFLIISVNPSLHNGVLPKEAWAWISKKAGQTLRVKPLPQLRSAQTKLSDILGTTIPRQYDLPTNPPTLADILRRLNTPNT